jgi:hypothetical protein
MKKQPIAIPLAAALCLATLAAALPARAQGALKPVEALIVNPPTLAVPVTGTVRLEGGVGAITGTLKSGDKNLTLYDNFVTVDTSSFGNHVVGPIDVSDYKEVRLSFSDGSCGPCGPIVAAVSAVSANGRFYQIDQFPIDKEGAGVGRWATRTYTVPGSKIVVSLRSTTAGTNNSVLVAIIGRAN